MDITLLQNSNGIRVERSDKKWEYLKFMQILWTKFQSLKKIIDKVITRL